MKFVLKLICLCFLLNACSNPVKKDGATENVVSANDSLTCNAVIEKQLILNDSDIVFPNIILVDKTIGEKINSFFTLEKISGYSLQEVTEQKEKFKVDRLPYGLTDLSYTINYNKNCLLSLTVNVGTCAAYPSYFSSYFNFDLETGDSLTYEKLLKPEKVNELVQYCDSILQERIAATKRQDGCDETVAVQLEGQKFTEKSLASFYMTENDFVFVYFFGFPHVMLGAEPDGEIKISRTEMKKYLIEK